MDSRAIGFHVDEIYKLIPATDTIAFNISRELLASEFKKYLDKIIF
jgi:hypothetical protein